MNGVFFMAGIVHELEQKGLHEQVRQEAANAAAQLAEAARLHKGCLLYTSRCV